MVNLNVAIMWIIFAINFIRFVSIFFFIGIGISMLFYPGGNLHDPTQEGYSLSHNFLSDLGAYATSSGDVNFLSSFFFSFTLSLFSFAGVAFLFIPQLFIEDRINYYLSIIGSVFIFFGFLFFSGVGLSPHDLYIDQHIFLAIYAFRFLVPATFFYAIVLFRSNIKNFYLYTILSCMLSTVLYVVYEILSGSPLDSVDELVRQVTIQKIIVLVSMFSMFFITLAFSSKLKSTMKKEI